VFESGRSLPASLWEVGCGISDTQPFSGSCSRLQHIPNALSASLRLFDEEWHLEVGDVIWLLSRQRTSGTLYCLCVGVADAAVLLTYTCAFASPDWKHVLSNWNKVCRMVSTRGWVLFSIIWTKATESQPFEKEITPQAPPGEWIYE